ncbi:3'-5' exonuclease [Catenovulum sp. SM1970]|uniref:3'-5' exonuclease n=1 Tax=Marinifaba aquimaris TaxID=2741323 RepID=UPI0015744C69|nr:3'-5' exonuclease [Marinifaba aquimaris]NTS76941.1 3'-5' exonuclease [Marinifaba aquimaris]
MFDFIFKQLNRLYKNEAISGELRNDWRAYQYLVVDLEMTALEIDKGKVISVAWMIIEPPFIQLSKAEHFHIKGDIELNQTSTIHGVVQADLADGESLLVIMEKLKAIAEDRILVFHHANLDMAFIEQSMAQANVNFQPKLVLDTMQFEYARYSRLGQIPTGLDLATSCKRYNLAEHTEHNALNDVMATAELFLAQIASAFASDKVSLAKLKGFF